MPKLSKSARSLEELDEDIRALQEKARRLEDQMDESFTYFQENSGSMFMHSILPKTWEGILPRTGIRIMDELLASERVQRLLTRLAERSLNKVGDILNWLSKKILKE